MRGVLLLLVGLMLTGCARCAPPDPGVKIVVPAMPTTLDWSASDPTSWVNYPVMLATLRGLTTLGPDNAPGPGLAEHWDRTRTPDGHEAYVFHLRRDLTWSDGRTPLRAQDFVFGWRRAVQGRERGEMADVLGADRVLELLAREAPPEEIVAAVNALGVQAIDDHTLRVVLKQPRNYFLARLANVYLFFPAPSAVLEGRSEAELREYFDRPGNGHPLALGPWRVEAWDRAGERVRLVRNPHSAFAPDGTQPEFVTLMRSEIGPALYDRARVGFVFIDDAAALRAMSAEDLDRRELLSTYFLAFNTQKSPLDRPEVRRAIAQAIERERLFEGLLPVARTTRTLLPNSLPFSATREEEARLLGFDPSTAKAVLANAGVDRPLRLIYKAGESFVPEVAIAERLKVQLERVGLKIELEPRYDFSQELGRRGPDGSRTWDLHLRRIGADYAHPNTFFTLFERNGNHQTGWEARNSAIGRFEALLDEADAAVDAESARRLYVEAQELLLRDEAVIVPLYHPDRYFRVAPALRGLDVDPFNFLSVRGLTHAGERR